MVQLWIAWGMHVYLVSMILDLQDHGILVVVILLPVTDLRMVVLSVPSRLNYPNRESGILKKIGLVMPVLSQRR